MPMTTDVKACICPPLQMLLEGEHKRRCPSHPYPLRPVDKKPPREALRLLAGPIGGKAPEIYVGLHKSGRDAVSVNIHAGRSGVRTFDTAESLFELAEELLAAARWLQDMGEL